MNSLTEGQTMKVLAYKRYGGPEVYGVEDRSEPVLSEEKPDEKGGEVFIRVHYSTVTATNAVFRRGEMARLFTGGFRPKMQVPGEKLEDLKLILAKMQSGDFKAAIDRVIDAHDIVEAHRYVDTGRKRGNLLVRMAS